MQNSAEYLGRNFERLLRWVYPGALFLVLLRMSRPQAFKAVADVESGNVWDLVVVGLAAGFVVYLLQGYVINQLISAVAQLLRWDVNVYPSDQPIHCRCLRCLVRWVDPQARSIRRRYSTCESLNSYLDYAWGVYHALSITGWLTILFFGIRAKGSVLASNGCWGWVVFGTALLLFIASLWAYAQLSRVRF